MADELERIPETIMDYWRCFHCDFVTMDSVEAQAHFGEVDDGEEFKPICRWYSQTPEAERMHLLQDYVRDFQKEQARCETLRISNEGLEYQVDSQKGAIQSYKPFRKCNSINDVFFVYDSMEGRALAAEEQNAALTAENERLTRENKRLYEESLREGLR